MCSAETTPNLREEDCTLEKAPEGVHHFRTQGVRDVTVFHHLPVSYRNIRDSSCVRHPCINPDPHLEPPGDGSQKMSFEPFACFGVVLAQNLAVVA